MTKVILGIVLTLIGAASLALSMVLQRYALSYPERLVPFMGFKVPRLILWFIGLIAYGCANGLYAAALNFGPLSLLACIFTLLLVFNMLFARWLLGEVLTTPKIIGCLLILLGVSFVVISAERDVPTEFEPVNIEHFIKRVAGGLYLFSLIGIVIASVCLIVWYDCKYPPLSGESTNLVKVERGVPEEWNSFDVFNDLSIPQENVNTLPKVLVLWSGKPPRLHVIDNGIKDVSGADPNSKPSVPAAADDAFWKTHDPAICIGSLKDSTSIAIEPSADIEKARPSNWLDSLMSLIYPGSLGLDEGIAHLTMKGTLAMMAECGACSHGVFWFFLSLWITSSVATTWWLKVVFARYETTMALPVEYGMVNLVSVCSGLIFYNEAKYMDSVQVVFSLVGLVIILVGIQCSRLSKLPFIGAD